MSCYKCHFDLKKGTEKYVVVSFKGESRSFHPECHQCSKCDNKVKAGMKYTVIPATGLPICEECWVKLHGGKSNELPTAAGGVSWTPKAPETKGWVWSQVELLDVADTPAAQKAKKEATEKPMGTCTACKKKIYSTMVMVDSTQIFHQECHKCYHCRMQLADSSFFELKSRSICATCAADKKFAALSVADKSAPAPPVEKVQQNILGQCPTCGLAVTGTARTASGKSYHPECFSCIRCKVAIKGGQAFFPEDDGVLCEKCGE